MTMIRLSLIAAIFACVMPTAVRADDANKAFITIISEKGFPHSAVLMEYPDGKPKWLGFKPETAKMPLTKGKFDEDDATKNVEKYVRFEVDAKKLAEVEKKVREDFKNKNYVVGKFDCVSLSVAFAEGLKFKVPGKPNVIPGNLVDNLAVMNKDLKPISGDDKKPFPWSKK